MTLGEARELEIPEVTEDVGKLLYGQPFQIPAQFAYTGRAVGTLVGVATGLAPDFNFVDVATPYARKFIGIDTENIGQTFQQLLSQLLETATILLKLPRSLERILTKLEVGQLEIRIGLGESHGRLRRSDSTTSAQHLALALTFIASLAGSYLFTYTHYPVLIWFCLILAAIIGLRLILRR
jgi:predicted unusual protein kinase regulating ubiquinone biosynthesis (AarF/ABC1/UbiB family)